MRRSVLFVDDDMDLSDVFKRVLERRGFQVDVFNDAELALSSFRPGLYDVAILDARMPKIDGVELSRKIGEVDSNLKICFLTGFHKEEFERMFPDAKAKALIQKPVSMDGLVRTLDDVIGH